MSIIFQLIEDFSPWLLAFIVVKLVVSLKNLSFPWTIFKIVMWVLFFFFFVFVFYYLTTMGLIRYTFCLKFYHIWGLLDILTLVWPFIKSGKFLFIMSSNIASALFSSLPLLLEVKLNMVRLFYSILSPVFSVLFCFPSFGLSILPSLWFLLIYLLFNEFFL